MCVFDRPYNSRMTVRQISYHDNLWKSLNFTSGFVLYVRKRPISDVKHVLKQLQLDTDDNKSTNYSYENNTPHSDQSRSMIFFVLTQTGV